MYFKGLYLTFDELNDPLGKDGSFWAREMAKAGFNLCLIDDLAPTLDGKSLARKMIAEKYLSLSYLRDKYAYDEHIDIDLFLNEIRDEIEKEEVYRTFLSYQWLQEYAIFFAFRKRNNYAEWPDDLRNFPLNRNPLVLEEYYPDIINFILKQYLLYRQFYEFKNKLMTSGITLAIQRNDLSIESAEFYYKNKDLRNYLADYELIKNNTIDNFIKTGLLVSSKKEYIIYHADDAELSFYHLYNNLDQDAKQYFNNYYHKYTSLDLFMASNLDLIRKRKSFILNIKDLNHNFNINNKKEIKKLFKQARKLLQKGCYDYY